MASNSMSRATSCRPPSQDEFYHADLIGLAAVTTANEPLGRVVAIHNFGAGDIIEIAPPHGATMLLPFTHAVVPMSIIAGGRVVIECPRDRGEPIRDTYRSCRCRTSDLVKTGYRVNPRMPDDAPRC